MNTVFDGTRETAALKDVFSKTLDGLLESDRDVVYLDADLMNSFGTLPLKWKYPGRCIDCGVQEANMIGMAAGMSAEGKKPYVHTFGPFASRRCFDQVFLSVGYAGNSVRIVGSDPGVTAAYNGGTHMPFEDIALYRTIPGAAVFDVCGGAQLKSVLEQTKDREGVTYIRTPRKNPVKIYSDDQQFDLYRANVLCAGADVVVIAAGIMVAAALEAEKALRENGIRATVIDSFCIKPLDEATLLEHIKRTGAVVTAENASVIGGLGSAVCELTARKYPVPVRMVGVNDLFGQVGDEQFLSEEYGLTAQEIVDQAMLAVKMK